MALQDLKMIGSGKVAIWHIIEDETQLTNDLGGENCPKEIISREKRLEWLAGRILLKQLTESSGLVYDGVIKDEFGKPFLKNHPHQISLSHSYPYVAAQIHPTISVGIDIEQPKEKLLRIGPRILDSSELENAGNDIVKHCIYWCAKEALYKINGKRGLLFTNHLHVNPFDLKDHGDLQGWIEADGRKEFAELHYIVTKDYVLVHSKTN